MRKKSDPPEEKKLVVGLLFTRKYSPELGPQLVEIMSKGASVFEAAVELNISANLIYTWAKQHPEFKVYFDEAHRRSRAWWERQGRENVGSKGFNSVLWMMNMSNRFARLDYSEPHVWSQKQVVEQEVKPIMISLDVPMPQGEVRHLQAQSSETIDVSPALPPPVPRTPPLPGPGEGDENGR